MLTSFLKKEKNMFGNAISKKTLRIFNKTRPKGAKGNLCNAPFRNLYFDTDGSVYTCCYNQKYPLGNISERPISEIWKSENAIKIREHIKSNDLSYGCDECRTALLSGQFLSSHIPFYDNYFAVSDSPNMMELQISNQCNLQCNMCSEDLSSGILAERTNRKFLKNPYDDRFLLQLDELLPGMKYIMFTGGEPFLIPIYYKLWERLQKVNSSCHLMVQTNGTVLNDKIKSFLERGNFHIGISLDSLNEKTYQDIRINADLKETLSNITYFSEYCHKNKRFIGISYCPMQQNWKEIPDMMNFCNKNDIEIYFNTVWYPGKNALWVLDTSQLEKILHFLKIQKIENISSVQKKNKETFLNLIQTIQRWHDISLKYDQFVPPPADIKEIEKIETELYKRISKTYLELNDFPDSNKNSETEKMISRFKNIFSRIDNNELKLRSLTTISKFRETKILSDIFREDDHGLFLLIKNIYKLAEIK